VLGQVTSPSKVEEHGVELIKGRSRAALAAAEKGAPVSSESDLSARRKGLQQKRSRGRLGLGRLPWRGDGGLSWLRGVYQAHTLRKLRASRESNQLRRIRLPSAPEVREQAARRGQRPGRHFVTAAISVGEPSPLDPDEARAKLLLSLWLAAELTRTDETITSVTPVPCPPQGGEPRPPSRIRRRSPVRPPRAC
jgi:hypothetical protein